MGKTSARLPIRKTEFGELLMLYDLETYLFQDVHAKFERGECISDFDFYCIVYWKSNRNRAGIRKGIGEGKAPGKLLDEVRQTQGVKEKVKVLTEVNGIGIAIASAILAVCYPEDFTAVDTRILRMLGMLGREEYLSDDAKAVKLYLEYNERCKQWRTQLKISLRRMDRLLWTKAWKEGLEGWIGNGGKREDRDESASWKQDGG